MKYKFLFTLLFFLPFIFGEGLAQSPWNTDNEITLQDQAATFHNASLASLDILGLGDAIEESLQNGNCLKVPMPEGHFDCFVIQSTAVLPAELAAKYPHIKTYKGKSIHQADATIYLVWTPNEFHLMGNSAAGVFSIDPVTESQAGTYKSYYRKDNSHPPFTCAAEHPDTPVASIRPFGRTIQSNLRHLNTTTSSSPFVVGAELRTYRFALAMPGEITVALGGVDAAMVRAAIIINDLNMLYERELCMSFQLIPDNDLYLFPDPATDPYTNTGIGSYLEENRLYMTANIGPENFDIGHVLNPTTGGVAYVGVTCFDNWKGGGTSPNDIEVIAHELGHQMGATHTFNYCGGSGGGYEPGNGNTTMSYFGLCGADNMPGTELLQYHAISFEQIVQYRIDYGDACGTMELTGNTPPVITVPNSGFTIPIQTPFQLTGAVTDDGPLEALTYLWEEYDLGVNSTPPTNPTGNAPVFRSLPYSNSPTRIFPALEKVVNGTSDIGETLPTYTRDFSFKFMVHDNNLNGGAADYRELMFHADTSAGPFEVTVPNTSDAIWSPGLTRVVEWDVANTDMAPVSCATVNILLSTDGGYTYPEVLASSVPNDGAATVVVPDQVGTQTRIKVEAADNVFFDISDADFEIVPADSYDFILEINSLTQRVCTENSTSYQISTIPIGAFNADLDLTLSGLPAGVTSDLPSSVSAASDFNLTLGNLASLAPGHYEMTLTATESGGSLSHSQNIYLVLSGISDSIPGNAIHFDGNDYVDIPDIGDDYQFGIDRSFSVEYWVKTTSTSNFDFIVGKKDYSNTILPGWLFTPRNGKIWFLMGDGDDRLIVSTNSTFNDGEWHHIAATLDRDGIDEVKLYMDGVLEATTTNFTMGSISNDKSITVGADSEHQDHFTGSVEEFRVWRKVLSPTEIRENMHRTLDSCQPDLISCWQFNESSGTVFDPVGHYNGTVSGASRNSSQCPIGTGTSDTALEANEAVNFPGAGFGANYTEQNGASVTATQINLSPGSTSGIPPEEAPQDDQYWVVNRYEQSGSLLADLTFELNENISAIDELAPSNFKLYQRAFNASSNWLLLESGSSANALNNTVTFPDISNYGQFLISRQNSIVPLDLTHFAASAKEKTIVLDWETEQEVNVAGFEVYRSKEQVEGWRQINWQTANNIPGAHRYSYTDRDVRTGQNYYYRLKILDFDGEIEYSCIRHASLNGDLLLTIAPTIAIDNLSVNLSEGSNSALQLSVYDPTGRKLIDQSVLPLEGALSVDLNVSSLPAGTYYLQVKMQEALRTFSFVKI
ncbi:MAG: LamG-like jellyroll fold domain-containing protein [Bacteroidota bacterium]